MNEQQDLKLDQQITVSVISLGCPKNLVDSEVVLGTLGEKGYILTPSWREAEVIIINTCSFIRDAKEESYRVISNIIKEKSSHQKLVVCGCLPQLEKRKLFSKFPQIDALLGSADFYKIGEVVQNITSTTEKAFCVTEPTFIYNSSSSRLVSTPPGYAYLKIAEGCSNRCSYCMIPRLRGNFRSREVDDVVKEAKNLAAMGVKELILTAQDITFYGCDRGEKSYLISALKKIEEIEGIRWIRLLYTHPAHFDFNLIDLMKDSSKICKYIDLPLQHTHNEILKSMNRPPFETALKTIDKIRQAIPEVVLRTTLMVGFPGEKEHHFEKLLKDVEKLQFDWLGVFTYSKEKNTPASSLPYEVPQKIKQERKKKLMQLQQSITLNKNRHRIGNKYPVMIDVNGESSYGTEGHTPFQTPEIDGKTLLNTHYPEGTIIQGKIKKMKDNFDLIADEA